MMALNQYMKYIDSGDKMTINCNMNCNDSCPAYTGRSNGACALVNAEVAKLDAERRYYEMMTTSTVQMVTPNTVVTFAGSTVNGVQFDACAQGCDYCVNTACVDPTRRDLHIKFAATALSKKDYQSSDVEGY